MLRASLVPIALSLLAASTIAQAADSRGTSGQGTDPERAACHPDVVRFCRELVKDDDNADVFAILNCLQTNRTKISRGCRDVLASHGQ